MDPRRRNDSALQFGVVTQPHANGYRLCANRVFGLFESTDAEPTVKLRQVQVESVDFVGTQIAGKECRAVGSNAAPAIGRRS